MNKIRYFTFCFLFCSIFVASCKHNGAQQKYIDYLQAVENKINQLQESNQNQVIENQSVYLGIDSLDLMDFKQVVANHLFFFFFSEETCSPCIQQTVTYVKEVFPDYETDDRIYFISPTCPARFRRNYYGKKLLNLENGTLGMSLEAENVPFIFTVSNDLVVEKVHVVNKSNFDKTLEFLKTFN